MENNIDIKKWCKWFKRIMKKYDECTNLIGGLIKQKNALNSNLERQNGDDVISHQELEDEISNLFFLDLYFPLHFFQLTKDVCIFHQ